MKLFIVPLAPNPTKVRLYIAERAARGTAMDIEQVVVSTLKGRHREPAHLASNPLGTLPIMELDHVSQLLESRVIIEYLEERFPDTALTLGEARVRARRLYEKVQPALDYLEALLFDGRALLSGASVGIADCTLQAALQFVRFAEADVLGERPALRAWDARYRTRKAATEVLTW